MKQTIGAVQRELLMVKPKSVRRIDLLRDLKKLRLNQLKREIREDRRASRNH